MTPGLAGLVREDCRRVTEGRIDLLTPLRESKVVLVGGTGFTGSWLLELLTALNDEHGFGTSLTVISSRAKDFADQLPRLSRRPDVTMIEADVRTLVELPPETNWIVHAAANPDNRLHMSDPVRTSGTILGGTHAVLNASTRLTDLRGLLYLSSGLVYGDWPQDPEHISEQDFGALDCNSIGAAYAESKRAAETMCSSFRKQYGLPTVIARPFAFVGPYQLLDRPWAINNFLRDALLGGPIRIQGDGKPVRSYMYGADAAFAILRTLIAGRPGSAYNLGSAEAIRLADLAALIARQFRDEIKIKTGTVTGGKPPRFRWIPDLSLAVRELGLASRFDLDASLHRTLLWHLTQGQHSLARLKPL